MHLEEFFVSTDTLNSVATVAVQPLASRSSHSPARTYSIEPQLTSFPACGSPTELESFLEAENPLGCFRGVMWVMVFNAAVFLLGIMIWQCWKLLR